MRFPLGKMTAGDVLDRGLKVLFGRLPAFYLINLIVLAPAIAVVLAVPFVADSEFFDRSSGVGLVVIGLGMLLLTLILQPIGTAAVLHIVMQEYLGRKATIGQAFSFAMGRFAALLGTSLLVGIVVLVGFICCIVPGIYFYVSYILVAQVVVLEGLSGGSAMQRSSKLVTDHRGRVFGVILLILIGGQIVLYGVEKGLESALPTFQEVPTADGRKLVMDTNNYVISTLVTQLVQILFASYAAVCTTLLYLDLRIRKEGFDMEMAASAGEERTSWD